MAYKRVLINIPEELLEEVDKAAKTEHRMRNEFVREALRDRISRGSFASSLRQLRTQAKNDYSEAEVDRDISQTLQEVRSTKKSRTAS